MREYSLGVPQDLGSVLEPGDLERLRAAGVYRQIARRGHLYRQGEPAGHVYLLHTGSARSFIISSLGHESTLRIHLPGSLLGLTALASHPWRDATAVALEPVEVFAIRRDQLHAVLERDGTLAAKLITLLVDRMRDFHFRVGEMHAYTVKQRIVRALLAVCQTRLADGRTLQASVELSHQDIANLVNTRRQTVTGILQQLQSAGLIRRDGRHLQIIDLAGLHDLLPLAVHVDR